MDVGALLGPYRIDRELGSGGMGKVYAAVVEGRCPGLDQGTRVALKVVHPHLLETPGFFKRFLREGEIGKSVVHQNVVRTHDCDAVVAGGAQQNFLVMEYIEGQTLRELMVELDRVPEELCRHIAREVCKGLAAVHAAGVIHRDMKPDNVLITADHVVKVMDLGVARLQDEALRLSQTGAFVGSIHYAAPECFQGGGAAVDGRADLHALGLVLYELACGTTPYLADTVAEILKKVLHEEPRRLGDVNPQLSAFFEEIVHCLLSKSPDERFATADELLAVLEEGEDSAWWHRRASMIRSVTKRPIRRIRIPRETAVYGREEELTKLRGLYAAAKSGDGCVVLIEGEAGIGKSRLVDELIRRMQQDGEDINFLFGSYPPGGAATASGGFSTAYREQFGEAGSAVYLPENQVLVPAFDALLRGEGTPDGAQALTKGSLQTCFVRATQTLAAERVTIVLIDDLHYAPEDGRALFAAVSLGLPGHRILLLGTTRPGVLDEEWMTEIDRSEHCSRLSLQRLGPKDLVGLLEDTFRSARLAELLTAKIAVKSDGNPFFVFEMIQGLREGGFITQRDDGSWVTTGVIDDIAVPSSVLDLGNARVARLVAEERDLLDVASCCGFEFDPAVLARAVGRGRILTLKALAHIERVHRLVRSVGRRFVFDHHQVQEALYSGLPAMLREEYHAVIGEALESSHGVADEDPHEIDGALAVDLSRNFLAGARAKRGRRYLDAALDYLQGGYLYDSAIELADLALALPGLVRGDARIGLLLKKATHLGHLGRNDTAGQVLEEARALERSGAHPPTGKLARAYGSHLRGTGRFEEALTVLQEAQDQAEAAGDDALLANALNDRGGALYFTGRSDEALEHCRRAAALFEAAGDDTGLARTCGSIGLINWQQGRLEDARASLRKQLAISRATGNRNAEGSALGNLGIVLQTEGRYDEALEHYQRYDAIAREIGNREAQAVVAGNIGTLFGRIGRLAEEGVHNQRYVDISREMGYRLGESHGLANHGSYASTVGDDETARSRFARSLSIGEAIGAKRQVCLAHMLLGVHEVRRERPAAARENLMHSLALAREVRASQMVLGSLVTLGAIAREEGDHNEARSLLAQALETAKTTDAPGAEVPALVQMALLPGGDVDRALAALDESECSMSWQSAMQARFLLFQATGDPAHLAAANRRLQFLRDHAPPVYRDSMIEHVRLHREIMAACKEQGL